MNSLLIDVVEFHRKYEIKFEQTMDEALADVLRNEYKIAHLREELSELERAFARGDKEGLVDSIVDLIYVALGYSLVLNAPFDEIWNAVQEANTKKIRAETKDCSKRNSQYDVIKPENWEPPKVQKILNKKATNYEVILFEGADCTGKTTLINKLKYYYEAKSHVVITKHATYPHDPSVFDYQFSSLLNIGKSPRRCIYLLDRHWLSEIIYGAVYRNGKSDYFMPTSRLMATLYFLDYIGAFTVICHVNNEKQRELYKNSKNELYPFDERITQVNCMYKDFSERVRLLDNYYTYDFLIDDELDVASSQLLKKINRFYAKFKHGRVPSVINYVVESISEIVKWEISHA